VRASSTDPDGLLGWVRTNLTFASYQCTKPSSIGAKLTKYRFGFFQCTLLSHSLQKIIGFGWTSFVLRPLTHLTVLHKFQQNIPPSFWDIKVLKSSTWKLQFPICEQPLITERTLASINGDQLPPERGTAVPSFRPMSTVANGCPSQLLLSSLVKLSYLTN